MSTRSWSSLVALAVPFVLACSPGSPTPASAGGEDQAPQSGSKSSEDEGKDDGEGEDEGEGEGEGKDDGALGELAPIAPAEPHAFSVLDLLEVDRVSSPALAPDGSAVVYVVRETDIEADRGRTSLWLAPVPDGPPRLLDRHAKGASQPAWAPDGSAIYFVSSRGGDHSQVFRLDVASGAIEQISALPVSVSSLVVSPDGQRLAVSAELHVDCPDLDCSVERIAASAEAKASGVVYDRMFVRHWDTWKDHRRAQLLVLDAKPNTAAATIVSRGLDADVPAKPFGGAEDIRFTPDGQALVFAARDASGGPGEPWSTNFDLFWAPVDGSAAPERLTRNPAWDAQPRFSPDGATLTWLAMARPGFEADRFRLMRASWTGKGFEGEPQAVTQAWDRSISTYEFAPDGQRVLAIAQDLGRRSLFSIMLDGDAEPAMVAKGGTVAGLAVGAEQLVIVRHDLQHPAELHVLANKGKSDYGEPTPLTHHNDELMQRVALGEPRQFEFAGAGGDTVRGFVVQPADFDPAQRYPLAFLIHGGPQGSFGDMFHHRWNAQTYAGAGYAVVMIDFHGSTGYGQAFTDAISGDWGDTPLEDLKLGLAHVLAENPWIDGERACALGASYGGYMINWIAGNWPDRFACLVNHDGIFDQRMMYYATEELWFPEWEHGGPEYADPRAYARFNPADHVTKWEAPMLVIHGSLDFRVPLEQGLATFTALQRRGVESRFLHFPDENHWVLRPANSRLWHDEVLRWLDAHTR